MESMTIDKAKEKKIQLQKDIADLLATFSNETGLRVVSIDVDEERTVGKRFYRTEVEVIL